MMACCLVGAKPLSEPVLEYCQLILQTTFSSTFSWMKSLIFHFEFHWILFLWVELTITQHLNQCWPDSLTHICGTRGRCVNWTHRNELQWNFNQDATNFLSRKCIWKFVLKMAAILSLPQCANLPEHFQSLWELLCWISIFTTTYTPWWGSQFCETCIPKQMSCYRYCGNMMLTLLVLKL